MTAYADSSFLVRLIVDEIGSEESVAVFRQLQRPQLVFNRLHSLEVRNALRQKAFMDAAKLPHCQASTGLLTSFPVGSATGGLLETSCVHRFGHGVARHL